MVFVGWYCCTVSFSGNTFLRIRGNSFFEKFPGNSFFSSKGGRSVQKGGRGPPFFGKRGLPPIFWGSRQICNTEIYQPSFPLVLVGMIPTKYQPIPTEIPTPVYNSSVYLLFVVPERIFCVAKLGSPIGVEGIERIRNRNELAGSRTLFQPNSLCFLRYNNWSCFVL